MSKKALARRKSDVLYFYPMDCTTEEFKQKLMKIVPIARSYYTDTIKGYGETGSVEQESQQMLDAWKTFSEFMFGGNPECPLKEYTNVCKLERTYECSTMPWKREDTKGEYCEYALLAAMLNIRDAEFEKLR